MLILAIGLVLAQSLTFLFVLGERSLTMRGMMVEYLSADVASSVAMLDRLPSSERGLWLERLKRPNYQLRLGDVIHSESLLAVPDGLAKAVAGSLSEALAQPVLTSDQRDGSGELRFLLRLQDGSPVSVVIGPPALHLSPWLLAALAGQFALLGTGCWLVVRQVTRPLSQLAVAARSLKPGQPGTTLPPDGPREVLEVTEAFDQMRHRID